MKIGVISDTHGLARPEALTALNGSDLILHAGDIGSASILEALHELAPVVAVRGNNDKGEWARALPDIEVVEAGIHHIYLLHDIQELDLDPVAARFRIVVSGHSHRPSQEDRAGVLYLNPGSAGPRRFNLPITVACLHVDADSVQADIINLSV